MNHRIMRNQPTISGNLTRIHVKNMQRLQIRGIHFLIRALLLNDKHRHPRRVNRMQFRHGQIRKRFHLKIHKKLPLPKGAIIAAPPRTGKP